MLLLLLVFRLRVAFDSTVGLTAGFDIGCVLALLQVLLSVLFAGHVLCLVMGAMFDIGLVCSFVFGVAFGVWFRCWFCLCYCFYCRFW